MTGRDTEDRLQRLESYLPRIQLRPTAVRSTGQVIQIIGGQTVSSVPCIQYDATDPTLTQVYDPDVDTVYPTGLGNGWLYDQRGLRSRRVLVRNDFSGAAIPAMGGWVYIVGATRSLTVASGDRMGTALTVYTLTWAI